MTKEILIRLLKSPIHEDVEIGLIYLTQNYSDLEIIDFFIDHGDVSITDKQALSDKGFFCKKNTIEWRYYHKGDLGFFSGSYTFIAKHPVSYAIYWENIPL